MQEKSASFFIYDYESFGVNCSSDRPAQFAGIRTDENLNIIGEPVMYYCQQTNDYLPSPEAVLITGITPQRCQAEGLPEYEFAQKILAEFSTPNTCIFGYNNIRFDDEMTRYTFFRNLIDPYAYSWKNGNSRWDLIDLVRACYALRPDGIQWVYDDDGLPCFRLDQLTLANGIEHSNAHDAMADVYATIEMAKLIKAKQPRLFDYYLNLRKKAPVEKLIDTLNLTPLVHISGMFGNARGNLSLIVPLAWNPNNSNEVICCDLAGDVDALLTHSAETNRERLYTKKEQLKAQGFSAVPLKGVHINKSPFLSPLNTLPKDRAVELGLDVQKCLENLEKIRQSPDIRDKVVEIYAQERVYKENDNVETTLYDGFFSNNDRNNLDILRKLPVQEWGKHQFTFEDKRIPALLLHYQGRYFFKYLARSEQVKWQKYRRGKIEKEALAFEERFHQCCAEYAQDEEKLALLKDLHDYVQTLFQSL